MNPVTRGIRNAFRNVVRTISIVIILGLSIGLCLTMLVAQKAVENKIASVKSSIGNTITISPAGFTAGSQANNALTTSELSKVKSITNITGLDEILSDRLSTTGSSMPTFGGFGNSSSSSESTTSLTSPIKLNLNGNSASGQAGGEHFFVSGGFGGSLPTNFSLPVSFLGTNEPSNINGTTISLTSGSMIDGNGSSNDALISSQMASKNNLKVGSTFTAYNATITVSGIFSSSDQSTQGTVILPLATLGNLSGQAGSVTSAVATVNSLNNLTSATNAIKSSLGSSADVVSAEQQADDTVAPLNSVKTVATYSLIGAVAAGAVIILLVMIMVVRERKKEIGVVKAIGGSNLRIMGEFMVESLTLAILGAVIGLFIGVVGGQPVTKALVSNTTTSTSSQIQAPGGAVVSIHRVGGGGGGGFTSRFGNGFRRNGAVQSFDNIQTQIGWGTLLDGFGAAILIAIVGSALSAGLIAKVRPSTVMRAE